MTNLQKKIAGFIATGALLVNSALPALAVTVTIEGNGPDTDNTVTVNQSNEVGVTQTNNADVHNDVYAVASTGDNEVEKATGGNVEVDTGDAKVDVTATNTLNANAADVACCDQGDYELKIAGNGPDTDNDITLNNGKEDGVYVTQDNKAYVNNDIKAKAYTGENEVEKSTGGDVKIDTGDATTTVTTKTSANTNSAYVGGNGGGSLSAWIVGNGPDTDNDIDLDLSHDVIVTQDNYASIHNDVFAMSATGDNEVEKATGGEVEIDTGDAETTVDVSNAVNFNWADLDCGCLLGEYSYKIAGNGPDSDNKLDIDLDGGAWAIQENVAGSGIGNELGAMALTGKNEVEESTGGLEYGDPMIDTGDASVTAGASNSGNVNVIGGMPDFEWPEMPDLGDYNFQFGFNWAFLFAWMNMNG